MALSDVGVKAVVQDYSQFIQKLDAMDGKIDRLGTTTTRAGNASSAAFGALKAAVLGAAGGITAALVAAEMSAMKFESRLASIRAVSGATASQMAQLGDLARTVGRDLGVNATDSAEGIEALVKAGVDLSDIMGGAAAASLNLAAAGEIDVKDAAEIAANAMNQFNLKGSDMAHITDLVAGAANASAIDVRDFQLSLQQSGAVASITGQTFDSLAVAIGVMGTAGLKSSDAGTSLKQMLLNLQPSGKQAAQVMDLLGITTKDGGNAFFDATGKAKGMRDIADVLQKSIGGLTEKQQLATLEIIFGSDAVRAAAVFTAKGAQGFDDLSKKMEGTTAAAVALDKLNTTAGDVARLNAKVNDLAITMGTQAEPAFRDFLKQVNAFAGTAGPEATVTGQLMGRAFQGLTGILQLATSALADFNRAAAAGNANTSWLASLLPSQIQNTIAGAGALKSGVNTGAALIGQNPVVAWLTNGAMLPKPPNATYDRAYRGDMTAALAEWDALAAAIPPVGAAAAVVDPQIAALQARLDALLKSFVSDKGGGAKKGAEDVKTALQELGVSASTVREAMKLAGYSADDIGSALVKMGVDAIDAGPILDGLGETAARIEQAFTKAGFSIDDARAAVGRIQDSIGAKAAKTAQDEADRKQKQADEEAERKRKQDEEDAKAEAKRQREAVVADITGTATRDILGGVRSAGAPKTAGQAAAEFGLASEGLAKLKAAGLDTGVAIDVMIARLGQLAGRFGELTGNDLASAGATTDRIRALIAAFQEGRIGVEEFNAGMGEASSGLSTAAGKIDEADAAAQKLKDDWQKLLATVGRGGFELADIMAASLDASKAWESQLAQGLGPAWTQVGETGAAAMKRIAEEAQIAVNMTTNLIAALGVQAAAEQARNIAAMNEQERMRVAQAKVEELGGTRGLIEQIRAADMTGTVDAGKAFNSFLQSLAGSGGKLDFADWLKLFLAAGGVEGPGSEWLGWDIGGLPNDNGVPGFAGGVRNFRGGLAVVGERGPELVSLPMGASVTPMSRTTNYNLNAHYTQQQEPQSIRLDLETLAMLSGG